MSSLFSFHCRVENYTMSPSKWLEKVTKNVTKIWLKKWLKKWRAFKNRLGHELSGLWVAGKGGGNLDRKFNHKHKSFCKIWSNLVLQNMANIVGSPQRQIYLLYHQKNIYRILPPTNLRISLNPQTTAQVGLPAGKRRLVGGRRL